MWEDPLFEDWATVETFRDCTLVDRMQGDAADLIANDPEFLAALEETASQEDGTRTPGCARTVLDRVKETDGGAYAAFLVEGRQRRD